MYLELEVGERQKFSPKFGAYFESVTFFIYRNKSNVVRNVT